MEPLHHQIPFQLLPEQPLHPGSLYAGAIQHPTLTTETILIVCDTPSILESAILGKQTSYFRRTGHIVDNVLLAMFYLKIELPQRSLFYGAVADPRHTTIFTHLAVQPTLKVFYVDPERTLWDLVQMDNAFQGYARKIIQGCNTLPSWNHATFQQRISQVFIGYPNPHEF